MSEGPAEAWDAVVIGAGPAGSVAAYELARRGFATLLVEKARFPRSKVCGCCVNAGALATLDQGGLGDAVREANGATISHFTVTTGRRSATLDLPGGLALSRAQLDATLARQAGDAGAVFEDGTSAQVQPLPADLTSDANAGADTGLRRLALRTNAHSRTVATRIVLAADGLAGSSLRDLSGFNWRVAPNARIGLAATCEVAAVAPSKGTIAMAVAKGGYLGRVPLAKDRTAIAAAVAPRLLSDAGGKSAAIRHILKQTHGRCLFEPEALRWQGAPTLTRRRPTAGPRLFVLGDAAGYVEPFTGEGIGWAIRSGRAAATLAGEAITHGWESALAERWRQRYRGPVRRQQRVCRLLSRTLPRPRLVRTGMALVNACPWLAPPVVGRLCGGAWE